MHRAGRWILWGFGGLLALLAASTIGLLLVANSPYGRQMLERTVNALSAGQVTLSGLEGHFPDALTVKQLHLQDSRGTWLTIDSLLLNWQPRQLLSRVVKVERLQAKQVKLQRLPVSTSEPEQSSDTASLPFSIELESLRIDQLDIDASLTGQATHFEASGQLHLKTLQHGELALQLQRLNSQDAYHLQASLNDDHVNAHLSIHEAAHGPLASFSELLSSESLNLDASLNGPLSAAQSQVTLQLDHLQAQLGGPLNLLQNKGDLTLSAIAPAMQLQQDLSWKTLTLSAHLQGSVDKLNVDAHLSIDDLNLANTAIGNTLIKLQGNKGQLDLVGELANLRRLPARDDLLKSTPLGFKAKLNLAQADYPFTFALKHPLLAASGQGTIQKGHPQVNTDLNLPNLQPLAALGGMQMAGNGNITLNFSQQPANNQLKSRGKLRLTGHDSVTKLLGGTIQFDLSMAQQGQNISLPNLNVQGKKLSLSADGSLKSGIANFNWKTQLQDVSTLSAALMGKLSATGQLSGALHDLSVSADLSGALSSKGYAGGSIKGNLQVQHLPDNPNGRLLMGGQLLGSPINLQLTASRPNNKVLQLGIEKANWKSVHTQGGLMITQDSPLPTGRIDLSISRLADLQPLLNQALTGSLKGVLTSSLLSGRPQTTLRLDAIDSGLQGSAIAKYASLDLAVNDPNGIPNLNGLLSLSDINAEALKGSAQLKLNGPLNALALQLSANLPKLSSSNAQLQSALLLDTEARSLLIKNLQADWQQQTLHLLSPSTIAFNDGLSIDKLRLGLQQAELEIDGRLSPALALSATLHKTPAKLLSLFVPDLAMTGTLDADAELQGSLALPTGQVRLTGEKLQLQQGPARALAPARFNANALLQGELADLDLKFSAGNDINLALKGSLPLSQTGLFNLQGEAALNLKQLDPLLTADGRQLHGQLSAKSQLSGTWSTPLLSGSAQVSNGEWQDYVAGTVFNKLNASLVLENDLLRIVQCNAHAGPGTLSASGTFKPLSAGMPIDLTLNARNAQPLASDQLTVNLDADLTITGLATAQMTGAGRIRLNRAEIRLPERIPGSIAVLKLSNASTTKVQAPKAAVDIGLDVTIEAPRKIFIRGRGLDAEMGGKVHLVGKLNDPQPDGEFKLQRGQFSMAGKTLDFDQGSISFDNTLNNPSLNFVANATNSNITATLTVAGNAKRPTFTLSSTPALPQDEILANLLFSKSTASLSPLEMVQIASTLASLTGVTSGIGDPLDDVRKQLGLDRLSICGANPSLEAGRYIAPGVFLGASQGISGGTPQATIQIDITKGLKLQGGVGTGTTSSTTGNAAAISNSIGAIYQFEY